MWALAMGETKTLKCAPEDAYGMVDPANVMKVPKKDVVDAVGRGESCLRGAGGACAPHRAAMNLLSILAAAFHRGVPSRHSIAAFQLRHSNSQ